MREAAVAVTEVGAAVRVPQLQTTLEARVLKGQLAPADVRKAQY